MSNQPSTFVSEIFPLTIKQPKLVCFSTNPIVTDRRLGNRIAYCFAGHFRNLVVIWSVNHFVAIGKLTNSPSETQLPSPQQWQSALDQIATELNSDIGWRYQAVEYDPSPASLSEVAAAILTHAKPFNPQLVTRLKGVEILRIAKHWAEPLQVDQQLQVAIALTVKSKFLASGNLSDFYEARKNRNDITELLMGMEVEELDLNSCGTIVDLIFSVSEHRQRLLKLARGRRSKAALQAAPGVQPLAGIKFQKDGATFYYALGALRPIVTKDSADKYEVDYGWLLKQTKLSHDKRQEILAGFIEAAKLLLAQYGFQLGLSLNSISYPRTWLVPQCSMSQIPLLFGNGVVGDHDSLLDCLKQGGVYQQSNSHQGPIRLATLRLTPEKVRDFLSPLRARFSDYKIECEISHKLSIDLTSETLTSARAKIQAELERLLEHKDTDLVLIILPNDDRYNVAEASLYQCIYSYLLARGIASQFIFEETVQKVSYRQIWCTKKD